MNVNGVLVIAPHPDDEIIGCGGSIAKHVSNGKVVTVVNIIERERSSLDQEYTDKQFEFESFTASKILGVHNYINFNQASRNFNSDKLFLMKLVKVLREICPQIVYLPHDGDGDLEHLAVHQAGIEALWMAQSDFFSEYGAPMPPPKIILGYEVWTPISKPQYVEKIDKEINIKINAMRCYKSQLNHVPWDEAILGLAKYRGAITAGRGFAEVFQILQLSQF